MTTRIADTRFVLDQLEVLAAGGNPDAEGHALPWTSAAVNLEGYLDYMPEKPGQEGELFPIARYAVDRSLLLAGTDGFRDERFGRSWSAMLAHGGCTRWRQLDNANHWVFTDYAAIAPLLQAAGLMSADDRAKLVGAIEHAQSVPAVRTYVRSFFDRQL